MLEITPEPSKLTDSASTPSSGALLGEASWTFKFASECDSTQTGQRVKVARNEVVLSSKVCSGAATYNSYLDLSSESAGEIKFIVEDERAGVWTEKSRFRVQKTHTRCDLVADRIKNSASGFAGGAGTESDPYRICTVKQFNEMRNQVWVDYLIDSHLYFGNSDTNGDGVVNGSDWSGTWVPMPSIFGVIDGGNYSIADFTTASFGASTLFDRANAVRNFQVTGSILTSSGNASALAYYCNSVYNVHVNNSNVTAAGDASGLCNELRGAIVQSSFQGAVQGGAGAGGLANSTSGAITISHSKFSGTVSGNMLVGGITGTAAASPVLIADSYSEGTVKGAREVGGISGSYGTLLRVHSSAQIIQQGAANSYKGGLIGYAGSVTDSAFTGTISSAGPGNSAGPITGDTTSSVVTNSSYLAASSSTCVNAGGTCNTMGTSVPDAQTLWNNASGPLANWDTLSSGDGTSDTWEYQAGSTPRLWWENNKEFTPIFSGLGTGSSPYLIQDLNAFLSIRNNSRYLASRFRLTQNLSTSSAITPIASQSSFMGTLDGQNYKITGSTLLSGSTGTGFFGSIIGARVRALGLEDFSIPTSSMPAGTLAGVCNRLLQLEDSWVRNVSVTGSGSAGGVCGTAYGANFSFLAARISAEQINVNGNSRVGGILGDSSYVYIYDSHSSGTVTGVSQVGGIAGRSEWLLLQRLYSSATVNGTSDVGGLIGYRRSNGGNIITNSFFAGSVNGNSTSSNIGLLVGFIEDPSNSNGNYAGPSGNCVNISTGGCNTQLVTGNAAVSAYYNSSSNPLSSWNFTTVWQTDGLSFPTLR